MKNFIVTTAIIFMCFMINAQNKTSGLLERNQIDEKYKWDLSDLYENENEWNKDIIWVKAKIPEYENFKEKLSKSAKILYQCLQFNDSIKHKLEYIYLFAKLQRDVEMQNEKFQTMWSRYKTLASQIDIASSFIEPEILAMDNEKLNLFQKENTGLKEYSKYFEILNKKKSHTLSIKEEEDLKQISKLVDYPYELFGTLVYSELPFPKIKNDKGNDIQLNRSTSWGARASHNRTFRKTGYNEYYKSLKVYSGTLTKNLNNLIEGKVYLAKKRNYSSALEASLDQYSLPEDVYHNLISSVKKNLKPYHAWMKMKKERMNLDTLFIYDTRVSIFSEIQQEYSWEEAKELCLTSIDLLGKDYTNMVEEAYNNRWIDAYPNKGKETGGYSSGPHGPHPYVKMNWRSELFDFYTLVHELGHYVHAVKTIENQPLIYRNYPSFLSEIASTTTENISQYYLINKSKSDEEKLYHIEKYLDNVVLYIYNSTMMAEFELELYKIVENGGSLSTKRLCILYGELLQEYYGEDVYITETDTYGWLEWPHYYLDYYLFGYATSFAASVKIASDIIDNPTKGNEKFMNFLNAGNSDYPHKIVEKAGVDLLSSEPYEAVMERMNELLDEIKKLSN